MNEQGNEFEIVDIYYSDCVQQAGSEPQWFTVRTGQELTDEGTLTKLKGQLKELRRKRKLVYDFGDKVIEVDSPHNASVRSIFQQILDLPIDSSGKEGLEQFGNVLAQKYLKTPWSRTRLFMVIRITMKGDLYLFTLVADLKDDSVQQIQQESLDFTTRTIQNIYGELKKGSMYPALVTGNRNEDQIMIFEERKTKYYPLSLECVLKQAPESEAKSLVKVLGKTCTLSSDQLGVVFNELRAIDQPSFGNDELGQALERNGVEVEREKLKKEWSKQFNYSNYEISPKVLSLDSVTLIISLDEFEIKCPIGYFPERIEHNEKGGFHYLKVRGREYKKMRTGTSRIQFS